MPARGAARARRYGLCGDPVRTQRAHVGLRRARRGEGHTHCHWHACGLWRGVKFSSLVSPLCAVRLPYTRCRRSGATEAQLARQRGCALWAGIDPEPVLVSHRDFTL